MLLHLHSHFTLTVSFTFRVFHRYLVGMQATRATVSFNFTSLIPFSVWQSMQLLSSPCKPRLPTKWVLIAELGVDVRVSGSPFTSHISPSM